MYNQEFWNERYNQAEYIYGTLPNNYFKQELNKLKPGKLLLPAEGEGRNAVYAARLGWEVVAFDLSQVAKEKALDLAKSSEVHIKYEVGEFEEFNFEENTFECVALIYAHFPADKKELYHQKLAKFLKPGGWVIFEAFSKSHLAFSSKNPAVGGPKNEDMLFSIEEIQTYFAGFEFLELQEKILYLNEGSYHNGKSAVIRFTGRKK